ncbi:MAG: DUF2244 domain-containing protein [Steroidobacteraceae bacterium]
MPQPLARIEISPNCSLTPSGAWWFFGTLCAACLLVASFFVVRGFWPVLPFAGLELGLVGWALHASMQRRHHRQTITVTDDAVEIEESLPRPRCLRRVVFPRHWAQVRIRRAPSPLHPSRLTIESHGRRCEVGSFLNEQERQGLARQLIRLVGRVNETPSLQVHGP